MNTKEGSRNVRSSRTGGTDAAALPAVVDRSTFQAELDALRVREKAHTREGDAIAAARRRLPMVEVDSAITLMGPHGPVTLLDVFEGRRQLIAYYFMWHTGHPAPEQCEGCTLYTTQVRELSSPPFSRHHLRHLLPGPVRGERALPRLHGLGHALVLSPSIARQAADRAQDRQVPLGLLPARRQPSVRDLLDDRPRSRGDGQHLWADGSDRVWTAGDVGRLARGLAATLGRQQRAPAPLSHRRTAHRPMVPP